jgi:hypothetical protein
MNKKLSGFLPCSSEAHYRAEFFFHILGETMTSLIQSEIY